MGALVTVILIVAVMLLGHYFLEHDDDHDEWRGW